MQINYMYVSKEIVKVIENSKKVLTKRTIKNLKRLLYLDIEID